MSETALTHPEVRHETSDVGMRGVILTVAGLLGAIVVAHALAWLLFESLVPRTHPRTQTIAPARTLSVQDRIKELKEKDQPPLEEFERQEGMDTGPGSKTDSRLQGYGPTGDPGFARIPIDRAMRLLAQQETEGQRQRGGLDRPTPANAGRGPASGRKP